MCTIICAIIYPLKIKINKQKWIFRYNDIFIFYIKLDYAEL